MRVMDLMTNYLTAIEGADRAFERDQRERRSEPSKRFLKAQERLDSAKAALEGCLIRRFTGWGLS